MDRRKRVISYIGIFLLVFLAGWEIRGTLFPVPSQLNTGNDSASLLSGTTITSGSSSFDLGPLTRVRNILTERYYDSEKLSDEKMAYGAAKGLAESLEDPYTVYMDPTEAKEFNEGLNSELEGIGAEMMVVDGALVVVNTLNGSPAKAAGVLPNDVVYKIDGQSVEDLSLYDAINKIRGAKGTTVTLTLLRKGKSEPFDLKITRDKITVASVESKEMENGIWLVTINQFSDDTKMEFDKALNEIKLKKPAGLILDLRFNGGGYLEGSVEILSALIKGEKTVTTIKYRDSKNNEILKTSGKSILDETPLVVLINEGSASAAEIVAAAIQDLKRGILIGKNSYGKGSVQEVDPLTDGSSLRYTIAKWYTPNDLNVSHLGIKPDIEIEDKMEDLQKGIDAQLNEAVKYLGK